MSENYLAGISDPSQSEVTPFIGAKPTLIDPSPRALMMGHVIDQLRNEGVPEANLRPAAAHLTGQAEAESSFDPNATHDGGIGYGIYGAGNDRARAMLGWLRANNYAPNSLEGQSRFMAHEAMTQYPRTAQILATATPDSLAHTSRSVTADFERPALINDRSGAVLNAYHTGPAYGVTNTLLQDDPLDRLTQALGVATPPSPAARAMVANARQQALPQAPSATGPASDPYVDRAHALQALLALGSFQQQPTQQKRLPGGGIDFSGTSQQGVGNMLQTMLAGRHAQNVLDALYPLPPEQADEK